MRKPFAILLIMLILGLAGCKPASPISEGVIDANPQPHFFEQTDPSVGDKSGSESEAKAVATQIQLVYPTPLPTYLVGSVLVTANPQATQAPTATVRPTQSATVAATTQSTSTPTKTATSLPSPTPTSTTSPILFAAQPGTPVEIQNFVNTTAGCSWQGIAGQVFDKDGTPLKNIVVRAGGTWNGQSVNLLGVTGAASTYGEGGYELVLGTKTATTSKTVWVQLYDLQGKTLSNKISINTSTDCAKNLILLNFKFIADGYESYIPLIQK